MYDFSDKYYITPITLLQLSGEKALDFLNNNTTNELKSLQPNFNKITLLLNEAGRVVEILYIFHLKNQEEKILIKFSENNKGKVKRIFEKKLTYKNISISEIPKNYYKIFFLSKSSYKICNEIGIKPPVADKFTYSEDLIAFNDDLYRCFCLLIPEDKIEKINPLLNKFIELNLNDFNLYRIINRIPSYPNEINETLEPEACNLENYILYSENEHELDENDDVYSQLPEMHCFTSSEEVKQQDLVYLQENNISGFISSVAVFNNEYYCLAIINSFNPKLRYKYHTKINNEKNFLKLKI